MIKEKKKIIAKPLLISEDIAARLQKTKKRTGKSEQVIMRECLDANLDRPED